MNINYIVPSNVEAYAIYAVGNPRHPSKNLKILNSNIYFEGHNDDLNVYNCAVKIMYYEDSMMDNNTIITSLPLKNVNHGSFGATLDSDYALTVGFERCDNFVFTNNSLVSDVNKRPGSTYPTLDCLMISQSDNCVVLNNSVYMTDFITYPGIENYLYGIDVYNLNNLTIAYNDLKIVTTGGKLALGTAYPIQITGPITKVNITENDIYTYANGPNIGIYSQNYYGGTELSITNNRINVTGLAGKHEWALVAGIESQDSSSYIANNIIEVHSVGPVDESDNIYGISYRQSTSGNHTFNIENNVVFSDGYSSVYLLTSDNSNVANNLLVSFNENAKNGNNGFKYGDISTQNGISFYNNKVIRAFDYFAGLNNNIDGGNELDYVVPVNADISNEIDGTSISGKDSTKSHSYNPLIPGHADQGMYDQANAENQQSSQPTDENSEYQGNSQSTINFNNGNGDSEPDSSSSRSYSFRDIVMSSFSSDDSSGNNNQVNSVDSQNSVDSNVMSNNSDASPSDSGSVALSSQSSSGPSSAAEGAEGASVSKYYELEEKLEVDEFIPSIFYVILAIILLMIGIKRRRDIMD